MHYNNDADSEHLVSQLFFQNLASIIHKHSLVFIRVIDIPQSPYFLCCWNSGIFGVSFILIKYFYYFNMQPQAYKLVIVGDGAVGKTSLLYSYAMNKFPKEYEPTVFDNYTTSVRINNQIINLGLWDTAGQEQFARLRPLAYPNTDIFLITFSVVDRVSFTNALKKWYPEVSKACPNAVFIFVGNKIDLRDGAFERAGYVQKSQATRCPYSECSALTRQGLIETFERSVMEAMKKKVATTQADPQEPWCSFCQLI